MDKRQRKKFEKLLFNMLARNPASFRLVAQEGGWIRIKDIHKALLEERLFPGLSPAAIEQHLLLFRPEGFEVLDGRARVLPAYQAPGIFEYPVSNPPEILFIPLRPRALHHADNFGLCVRDPRAWIVLLSSRKEALLFGKRFHNSPVLCKVNARRAGQDGVEFRHAGQSIYLAKIIERQWLILPLIPEDSLRASKEKTSSSTGVDASSKSSTTVPPEPGSFFPSVAAFEGLFPKNTRRIKGTKAKSSKRFRKIDRKKRKK